MPIDRSTLRTPCYILRKEIAVNNAKVMLARADAMQCTLRPHVKTHKTLEGALLQTGGRPSGIVVSTLREAEHFADTFTDILYAVPITPDKLPQAAMLKAKSADFSVMVDNTQQLNAILAFTETEADDAKKWRLFIMADCGYHRDGVDPKGAEGLEIAKRIQENPKTHLAGVYTHGGGSYAARSVEEIQGYAVQERDAVVSFAERLRKEGIEVESVGVGSTPTCSHPPADGLSGVTEMHPGNYVTYDSMQSVIGSCAIGQVAVRVLTRIVGIYPERNMMTIDLGWTGCSVQGAEHGYGILTSHPELRVRTLKQEAGEVIAAEGTLDCAKYNVGEVLELAPWHSCASGALHAKYVREARGVGGGEEGVY